MLAHEGQEMDDDMIYIQKMELGLFTLQQVPYKLWLITYDAYPFQFDYCGAIWVEYRIPQGTNTDSSSNEKKFTQENT